METTQEKLILALRLLNTKGIRAADIFVNRSGDPDLRREFWATIHSDYQLRVSARYYCLEHTQI